MKEICYRNEYKHEISQKNKIILTSRLRKFLPHDENAIDNSYFVKSLYFDTIYDEAFWEKEDGAAYREKFRIRYYNNDHSFIRLEKKVKDGAVGYKRSARLTKELAEQLIQKNYDVLADETDPLLQEFYTKCKSQCMEPKVIIAYEREAFAYAPGNVRVTFDYDLHACTQVSSFFSCETTGMREPGIACVLEVKFDKYLPLWIQNLVQVEETSSTSHSKYVIGRHLNQY
jgi:hypothetical protein